MTRVVNLIVFEDAKDLSDEIVNICKEADLKIYHLWDLVRLGAQKKAAGETSVSEPVKDDVFMFSYTSGTTGDPKGVKLSHKMLIGAGYAV